MSLKRLSSERPMKTVPAIGRGVKPLVGGGKAEPREGSSPAAGMRRDGATFIERDDFPSSVRGRGNWERCSRYVDGLRPLGHSNLRCGRYRRSDLSSSSAFLSVLHPSLG